MQTYKRKNAILNSYKVICRLYILSVLSFTVFRITLLLFNWKQATGHSSSLLILRAMFIGWRFDTVIACYILALPLLFFLVLPFFNFVSERLVKIVYGYLLILFLIAFVFCSVDIPFYNQFQVRLNNTLFLWADTPVMSMKFAFSDMKYYGFFLLFILVVTGFIIGWSKIRKLHLQYLPANGCMEKTGQKYLTWYLPLLVLTLGLCFLGIRGRAAIKSPIHTGTAFFCENPMLNQLGLNPVFTLLRSHIEARRQENKGLSFIDERVAAKVCADYLKSDSSLQSISPIARQVVDYDSLFKGKNVVVVLMESMCAYKMKHFGYQENLTPFLDSLVSVSWSFERCYSAGIHTFNGIYSTMFAHPALMKKHSLNAVSPVTMSGFSNVLSKNNYQTVFFTTHDEQFDNMAGFMLSNGFGRVIGEKDYPYSEVKSALGVPDYYMFDYAIPVFNKMSSTGSPFFAAMLTSSNHSPYIVPDDLPFKSHFKEARKQGVEFSDWSLRQFVQKASQQPWFNNTVFVFTGDHGSSDKPSVYDVMPDTYHHIPFLIYAPGTTTSQKFNSLATQTDIFATVMGRLGISYINNTFGIDLLKKSHDQIVFSSDDKLACMNDSLLYIYRENAPEGLYRYQTESTHNDVERYSNEMKKLKNHAFSYLQTSQYMINKGNLFYAL